MNLICISCGKIFVNDGIEDKSVATGVYYPCPHCGCKNIVHNNMGWLMEDWLDDKLDYIEDWDEDDAKMVDEAISIKEKQGCNEYWKERIDWFLNKRKYDTKREIK